jgi:hypothetical protein
MELAVFNSAFSNWLSEYRIQSLQEEVYKKDTSTAILRTNEHD